MTVNLSSFLQADIYFQITSTISQRVYRHDNMEPTSVPLIKNRLSVYSQVVILNNIGPLFWGFLWNKIQYTFPISNFQGKQKLFVAGDRK